MFLFFNNNRIFALNICAVSFILLLSLSCTTTVKNGVQASSSQLYAENSMMKKRLPLIERENDVLKTENQQHRMKIQDMEKQNKQLAMVLTSLNEKYTNDMAISEEQIINLQETLEEIEKKNSEIIEVLNSQNIVLEEKLVRETQELNKQIIKQKKAFNQEREQIVQESAKKELNWSTELGVLKKQLEPKELQISSLKLAISEISMQLGAATALSEALRKARDESLAELESVRAANVNMIKKMAELSGELTSQNIPATKNH